MDWFDALPDSLQQLLIGAAAEYAGLACRQSTPRRGPGSMRATRRRNSRQPYRRRSSARCKMRCCRFCLLWAKSKTR